MPLINVKEVQEILGVPESTAYGIIRELNKELVDKGSRTIRGKVEKTYLQKRYGLNVDWGERTDE